MKRCLIFNPYFEILGGGERYTVALGSVIAESHEVTYASPFPPNPELVTRLGFPPIEVQRHQLAELPALSVEYDLVVVISLGVPPRSFASRSVLVVQFPREEISDGKRVERWRRAVTLRLYRRVVYSDFVRQCMRRSWHVDGDVLMPGIALAEDQHVPKERIILSVGRFMGFAENAWNSKRHDVLIAAFTQLPPDLRGSWKLVLAGGYAPSPEMDEYVADLERSVDGLNVSVEANVTPDRLADLQARARLFWHASGFERPPSEPEAAEHFGMSTVEAMSNGAIPMVYADGGQLEIVTEDFGRLWRSVPQLVAQTTDLMRRSSTELDAMGAAARTASTRFGSDRFRVETLALLDRLGARRPQGRVRRALEVRRRRAVWRVYGLPGRLSRMIARLPGRAFRA